MLTYPRMSYFVLKTKEFDQQRVIYLLKKRDVPDQQQKHILRLNCSSIIRVTGISKLMIYLNENTCDAHHREQPYILRRLNWNEAVGEFGFDYVTDTSESDSETTGKSSSSRS